MLFNHSNNLFLDMLIWAGYVHYNIQNHPRAICWWDIHKIVCHVCPPILHVASRLCPQTEWFVCKHCRCNYLITDAVTGISITIDLHFSSNTKPLSLRIYPISLINHSHQLLCGIVYSDNYTSKSNSRIHWNLSASDVISGTYIQNFAI